jgi:hypothetical protein
VLVAGFGYVRASGVLGISPQDMAALLRAALLRLAAAGGRRRGRQSGSWA